MSVVCTFALASGTLSSGAGAAQLYVQPSASTAASSNSNLELAPSGTPRVSGPSYDADAAALFSIATPDSQTTVRPRIRYDYYPSAHALDTVEGYLDFNSQLQLPRDRYSIYGEYVRLNDLHAEIPSAQYNSVNPGLTPPPTTGQVAVGAVSNLLIAVPDYVHNLTPLTTVELTGTYERMTFSPDDTVSHVDFNYGVFKAAFGWTTSPRSSLSFGVFGSTYQTGNIDSSTNSGGGEVDFSHSWSPVFSSKLSLLYEYTKTDEHSPIMYRNTANSVGFSFETVYDGQTDQLRATLGRSLMPSSSGGLYETDQARLQYKRDLTERLSTTGAVVYLRTRDLGNSLLIDDRDYAATEIDLTWMFTPVLYIDAGYSFQWQSYLLASGSATNNSFSIELGYRGLPRQR